MITVIWASSAMVKVAETRRRATIEGLSKRMKAVLWMNSSGSDIKKTQKTPQKEIERAEAIREEYYRNKNKK